MAMKIKKEQLRQSARVALAEQGYSGIELAPGPGIVPGARLRAMKEGRPWRIAVRTSSDREVALLRTPSGKWRTLSYVDLVLVAVPADDTPAVDVMAFEPKILLEVFNATVQALEKNKRDKSRFKVPVFLPLDDFKDSKTRDLRPGLKLKAAWQALVPLGQLLIQSPASGDEYHRARFFEHIKKQIADFIGVDVGKIDLEIRINP
jgi:hypothetical protein